MSGQRKDGLGTSPCPAIDRTSSLTTHHRHDPAIAGEEFSRHHYAPTTSPTHLPSER